MKKLLPTMIPGFLNWEMNLFLINMKIIIIIAGVLNNVY